MARRVSAPFNLPVKVLEVACGTGISTRHLAGSLPEGSQIVATDLNEAMLDHANRVNGNLPNVSYSQADALELSFEDETFDAVVCQFGIIFFPDKAKGMSEMSRVLKPNGILALNVWDSLDKNASGAVVDQLIKRKFDDDPPNFLEVPFGFHEIEAGRHLFFDAGYETVEVAQVKETVSVADYGAVARGFITGNPTIIEVENRTTVNMDDLLSAAVAELETEFGPPPADLSFQEIVYLAQKDAD